MRTGEGGGVDPADRRSACFRFSRDEIPSVVSSETNLPSRRLRINQARPFIGAINKLIKIHSMGHLEIPNNPP